MCIRSEKKEALFLRQPLLLINELDLSNPFRRPFRPALQA
jgi:hypothetical protein